MADRPVTQPTTWRPRGRRHPRAALQAPVRDAPRRTRAERWPRLSLVTLKRRDQ